MTPPPAPIANITQVLNYGAVCPSTLVQRTGPHEVGTLRARLRVSGAVGRPLSVQLWYPVEGPPTATSRLKTFLAWLRHPMWAPARRGAQLLGARSKLPFIAYVPGAHGWHHDNTYTLANLASHGFILAAIHNPFVLAGAPEVPARRPTDAMSKTSWDDQQLRSGVLAASTLLDALTGLKPNNPIADWAERLDLKRVGILGYALGGIVAVASVAVDGRYSVAANLDGAEGDGPLVKVPYLHMRSDSSLGDATSKADAKSDTAEPAARQRSRTQASLPTSHIIEVAGTRREHFSDRLVSSSLFAHDRLRTANMRIRAIIDAYTVAFFKTYLEGSPHPLMCVRHSPYPEVRFIADTDTDVDFPLNLGRPRTGAGRSEPH